MKYKYKWEKIEIEVKNIASRLRKSRSYKPKEDKVEKMISKDQLHEFKCLKSGDISPKIAKRIERALESYKSKMRQLYGDNYETNRDLSQRFGMENTDQFKVDILPQDSDLLSRVHTKHKHKKRRKSIKKNRASPETKRNKQIISEIEDPSSFGNAINQVVNLSIPELHQKVEHSETISNIKQKHHGVENSKGSSLHKVDT